MAGKMSNQQAGKADNNLTIYTDRAGKMNQP